MRYSGAVQRKLVNHHKGLAAAIIVFGASAVYPVSNLAGQRPIWRRVAATTANISSHKRGHKNDRPRPKPLEKDVAVLFEKLAQDNSGMRVANLARRNVSLT